MAAILAWVTVSRILTVFALGFLDCGDCRAIRKIGGRRVRIVLFVNLPIAGPTFVPIRSMPMAVRVFTNPIPYHPYLRDSLLAMALAWGVDICRVS